MPISVLDLFRIGIGPSSSQTVGPMRAAFRFLESLRDQGRLAEVAGIRVELFVSLDKVIETMRQPGTDMQTKHKGTSLGGLAVNVSEC